MTTNKPYPISKHEFVFAKIDNINVPTFKFKFNELLKNKKIVGLSFHPASYVTKTPDGDTLVPSATAIAQCFLTLKTTKGFEDINKLPLYLISPGVNVGGTYEKIFPIDSVEIDFEQSYISNAGGIALVQGQVFMLSVWYNDGSMTC